MKAQRAYLYKDIAALERRVATLLTLLERAIEPAVTDQDRARFPPPPTEINSTTHNRWGGVVGVVAEWAVGGGWTLKSEALYMHFTQQQDRLVSPAFAPGVPVFTNTDNAVVARVGFNYIFGGSARPAY